MEHETEEQLFTRYLLGELSEEQQAEVEERFFADNRFFEQLLVAESTLIDEYASGELRPDARERVEALLHSSPQQRRELNYGKEFSAAFSEAKPGRTGPAKPVRPSWLSFLRMPLMQASLAFSGLLIIVSAYLLAGNIGLRSRVGELQSDVAVLKTEQQRASEEIAEEKDLNRRLSEELDRKRDESGPDVGPVEIASLLLTPDYAIRGGATARKLINIGPTVRQLRIQVDFKTEDAYERYVVLIKTFDGKQLWSSRVRLTPRANSSRISLTLPGGLLPRNDYILTVRGSMSGGDFVDLEDYAFGVRR